MAHYKLVREDADVVVIRDMDDGSKTITNDAENVVRDLAPMLAGRELHYIDTDGLLSGLRVTNGEFAGYYNVTEED